MTQITIENDPVSRTLKGGSLTVPSGEVWRVTIAYSGVESDKYDPVSLKVNGAAIVRGGGSKSTGQINDVVLVGGDKVSVTNLTGDGGIHISGFKVKK